MNSRKKPYYPNLLLVTGAGRNVGKTTFLTGLIKKFSDKYPITAVKISPHFHSVNYTCPISEEKGKFAVYLEEKIEGNKNSNLMKAAGAEMVFYIQSKEKYLIQAFCKVIENSLQNSMIMCESGGLHNVVEAGILFYINDLHRIGKPKPEGSIEIHSDGNYFEDIIETISVIDDTWIYEQLNERV